MKIPPQQSFRSFSVRTSRRRPARQSLEGRKWKNILENPYIREQRSDLSVLNDDTKQVTVDDEPVKMTPIEYNILLLLMKNQGRVFSINQIYQSIWNEDAIGADNTVAVHIRHIREKIEINPKEPRYLKVVWGVGYKIDKEQA